MDEVQLQRCAATALSSSSLILKEQWHADLVVETVTTELLDAGLPADAAALDASLTDLLMGSLPEVELCDVQDFCSTLFKVLQEAAADSDSGEERGDEDGTCAMCERFMPLTRHHLIPKDVHDRYKKRGMAMEELQRCVLICRPCHSAIHRTYPNARLAVEFPTLDALLQSEPLQRHVQWARKQRVTPRDVVKAAVGHKYRR